MKNLLLLLFLMCYLPAMGQANCSYGSMTETNRYDTSPCTLGEHYVVHGTTTSATFDDKCIDTNNNTTYADMSSTNPSGTGQCVTVPVSTPCGGTGQPACNYQIINCFTVVKGDVTNATSPTDYNRFYNRGYGNLLNSNRTGCMGQGSGTYSQDFRQCQGVACGELCWCASGGCGAHYFCDPSTCQCLYISPIIIDTTGRGFKLTSADSGVMFDMLGEGHPIKMSWTAGDSGNAFLALDRNHNGKIDSGKELFGNLTEQPPSDDANGYLALAEFDKSENGGNGDGIIDWHDAVFSQLRLWIDENHDGVSQPNELHTLPELGVFSLSLKYREDDYHYDEYGNWFHYKAAVNPNPLDGQSRDGRWGYDVFFETVQHAKAQGPSSKGHCGSKAMPLNSLLGLDLDHLLK